MLTPGDLRVSNGAIALPGIARRARLSLAYPQARDFGPPADQIGCRVNFEGNTNQIIFRSAWLDQPANLGNKTTYPVVVDLCDP